MQEMLQEQRDCFYYLTVTNANYGQPSLPASEIVREGILRGIYCLSPTACGQIQLLGSGAIMTEVLEACDLLRKDWSIEADVWSVTSYAELQRDGLEQERRARLQQPSGDNSPFVTRALLASKGPIIATSDYVRALPELIRAFIPRRYVTLGTDGFGRSDTRRALRRFFEVDAASIVIAALKALADEGALDKSNVCDALRRYDRTSTAAPPWTR